MATSRLIAFGFPSSYIDHLAAIAMTHLHEESVDEEDDVKDEEVVQV